jgi:hypothetical protein
LSKKRVLVTMVTTPRLGEASFAGDNGEVVRQGFGLGAKFEQRGEELGSVFVAGLYTALECVPRHTVEEGGGASARRKAPRRRAALQHTVKMRTTPSIYFFSETLRGLVL